MMFFIFALFCKITYAFLLNLCSPHSTSGCKYRKKFIHSLFFFVGKGISFFFLGKFGK